MANPITDDEITIIRTSWNDLLIESPDVAIVFYNRLFYLEPRLRPLFREDIRTQARKFLAYLAFIVNNLHDWSSIETEIKLLGKKHVDYQVTNEDYGKVKEALIYTLEKLLKGNWTPQTESAWTKLYDLLAKTMTSRME